MNENRDNHPRSDLSTEHKVAFVLLMFLGIGGMLFGFKSFGASLSRPFDLQLLEYSKSERFLTRAEQEEEERQAQKQKDTDHDGISDYDELYIYKTSPYLEDTDSDGQDDRTEVFAGADPNCPIGRTCGAVVTGEDAGAVGSTANDLVGNLSNNPISQEVSQLEFDSPEQVQEYFQSLTLKQIREALISSGVSEEEVNALDDEMLQSLFDTSLQDVTNSGAFEGAFAGEQTDESSP